MNKKAILLAGGAGTRLYPLTKERCKPAVPLAGKYRLVDIPISNCLHADIRRIFVLTQFNSASLNRHIAQTYRMDLFSHGFVEILAADERVQQALRGNASTGTRVCLPGLLGMMVGSDAVITASYYSIPVTLLAFMLWAITEYGDFQ